uniref:monofunctional biosynthetic peptidoglycan transglycosylase n=1 Tax=Thaumasiovibrio occultus TaxID=1891184 RepID=UPI000B357ACE|nr:monofunctional biosynthetic peptidoglycan transglycosylase [Thaumasiovibrio occultus]
MWQRCKKWVRNTFIVLLVLPMVFVALFRVIDPPIWGWQISRTFFPPEGYRERPLHTWVDIDDISPNMILAVIASEDQKFPRHYGVDLRALFKVLMDAAKGGPARGASTITQQTAKNVFLFPSKTYVRKAYELYIALLLELGWGKARIMEVYLNVAEFGPGIYGVEAASQHYFGISAKQLSKTQAARLAVILPNPYKMQPVPLTDYVSERSRWVLRQMNNLGTIRLN